MNELTLRPAVPGDAMPLAALEASATAYPWSALQYRDSITAGHRVSSMVWASAMGMVRVRAAWQRPA